LYQHQLVTTVYSPAASGGCSRLYSEELAMLATMQHILWLIMHYVYRTVYQSVVCQ